MTPEHNTLLHLRGMVDSLQDRVSKLEARMGEPASPTEYPLLDSLPKHSCIFVDDECTFCGKRSVPPTPPAKRVLRRWMTLSSDGTLGCHLFEEHEISRVRAGLSFRMVPVEVHIPDDNTKATP